MSTQKNFFSYLFFLLAMVIPLSCAYSTDKNDLSDDLKVLHEKTFQISSGKKIELDASVGDVMITSWDKSEVYIKVLGNEKAEDKIEFEFNGTSDLVKVKAKKTGSLFNWFGSVVKLRFEIKVPASFSTKVSTSGGDIKFADVSGVQYLSTSGGDIIVKNSHGKLDASTSGGDISTENSKGLMMLSTSGGDVIAKNFEGDLSAETSGGDIHLSGMNSKVKAETSGGDIVLDYSGSNDGIDLSTSGGDIMIKLPADFSAAAKLYTSGGDISCELTTNNVGKKSSSKLEGDLNSGGNLLHAETSGGDIVVSKK